MYELNSLSAKKRFRFFRRKKVVKAVAGKTPVAEKAPKDAANYITGFTARYLYPEELADDPSAWESENFYFGETPTLYLSAVQVEAGAATKPAWYEDILKTIVGTYQQKQAIKQTRAENIRREAQGLPPVSTAEIKRQYAPQVEIGISPQIRNMLLIGGLAAGGFFLVNMMQKRRA